MIPMECVSGNSIKLRTLPPDNGNWWKLFLKYHHLVRISIIVNVLRLLVCRTSFLGYHHFVCPTCTKSIKVPHSCKSRFCPSCGKKAVVFIAMTSSLSHRERYVFWRPKTPVSLFALSKKSVICVTMALLPQ